MAKKKKSSDYLGLGYGISLLCAILMPIAWIFGIVTRFQEKKYVAAVIRIFGGWIIWVLDLIFMIKDKKICRFLNV